MDKYETMIQQKMMQSSQDQPTTRSGSCSSPRDSSMSNNPAFKYFHNRDYLARVQSDPSQMEGGKRTTGKKEEDSGNISVKIFSTMPKRNSSSNNEFRSTRSNSKIHVISGSPNNGNHEPCKQQPTVTTGNRSSHSDVSNGNHSGLKSKMESDKTVVNVAKLIRQHTDEIQSTSQWKRFSGNDRCKWFFRSLRGERMPRPTDEIGGSEFGGIRAAECSRCRLASLTNNQLYARIEALQSCLQEKKAELESFSTEVAEKDKKIHELESAFDRLSVENNELKASINRRISEQIFGKRVILTPDLEPKRSQDQRVESNKLNQSSSLRFKDKPIHFSQPSLTLLANYHNGIPYENKESGRGADNDRRFRNESYERISKTQGKILHVYPTVRSDGGEDDEYDDGDDDNAVDEASAFLPLDKTLRYYPALKPKPILSRDLVPPPLTHRRIGQISLTDREWHSTEGVASARVAATAATATSSVGEEYSSVGDRRSAKSSLELDDSLCVEFPNRTFRQQMECLRGAIQSVDSLKSEPLAGKFKTRRRRETVATLLGENACVANDGKDKIAANSKFQISSTRKLSSYSMEQQRNQAQYGSVARSCGSESGPSWTSYRAGKLIKASSSDLLYRSPDYTHHRRPQRPQGRHQLLLRQPQEIDPRNYYLHDDRDGNNNDDDRYIEEISKLTETIEKLEKNRTIQLRTWSEEKMRVIEYQKKLQDAYMAMTSQCKKLENDLRQFVNFS